MHVRKSLKELFKLSFIDFSYLITNYTHNTMNLPLILVFAINPNKESGFSIAPLVLNLFRQRNFKDRFHWDSQMLERVDSESLHPQWVFPLYFWGLYNYL